MSEVMTRDDVIRATAAHIQRVGTLMVTAAAEISRRAVVHDASKWSPEEWPAFEQATPQLAGMTYGSEEYKAALRSIQPALQHHYSKNSHHPEYFSNDPSSKDFTGTGDGINGMTLLDLLEMLCDWKAATERHNDGSILNSLTHNEKRFGISPQLMQILKNTVHANGWTT